MSSLHHPAYPQEYLIQLERLLDHYFRDHYKQSDVAMDVANGVLKSEALKRVLDQHRHMSKMVTDLTTSHIEHDILKTMITLSTIRHSCTDEHTIAQLNESIERLESIYKTLHESIYWGSSQS